MLRLDFSVDTGHEDCGWTVCARTLETLSPPSDKQILETLAIAAEKRNRVNAEIAAETLRLISENGEQVGIVDRAEALNIADEAGLDLVEISPNTEPPVCRLMDFGKFLFQQNKRRAAARKKQAHVQVKEIKFRPGTEEADYQTKLRNLKRFLSHGDKTKVTLWFRGREMRHQELGRGF